MTDNKIEFIGRLIGSLMVVLVDILAGYLMGHHFHSIIIGYVTYAVLISLDMQTLRLSNIRDLLKGGR